jgi:hypothetical protein
VLEVGADLLTEGGLVALEGSLVGLYRLGEELLGDERLDLLPPEDVLKYLKEEVAVVVIVVDGEAGVPSRGDMGESAWQLHAQWPGHGGRRASLIFYFKI